jgi:hypothetical protein
MTVPVNPEPGGILKPQVLVKKYVHHTYLERLLTISQLKYCGTACFKAFREYKISKTYESEERLKGNQTA